jgi:hypothetical protein
MGKIPSDRSRFKLDRGDVPLKKSRPLVAIISTVILGAPVVHAQTPADFQTPSTSIFTVVPTPNGHPKPYQNDLHSVSASSPADIWAVGHTGIHFDGTKWTAVFLPKIVGDNTSKFEAVVDLAPNKSGPLDLAASLSAMAIKSSSISMVPSGASSPVPSFSPPTSPPWSP